MAEQDDRVPLVTKIIYGTGDWGMAAFNTLRQIFWDELQTGERHEGVYYGIKNFIRKLTTAFAIFLVLQVLGWMGYQTPPESAVTFMQPDAVLTGIRVLIGPVASLILVALLTVTWLYPLNRSRYERVQRLLVRRRQRDARR